jgi:hypothetical protein
VRDRRGAACLEMVNETGGTKKNEDIMWRRDRVGRFTAAFAFTNGRCRWWVVRRRGAA